jgi:hypothetical protein
MWSLDRSSLPARLDFMGSFSWVLQVIVLGLSFQALCAGEWTPIQYPLDRYEHIWKSSPFIAATEVTPQGESIAQRYAVTGFGRIGSSDVVFLFDRKSLSRFSIEMGSPTQGVELIEVTKSEELSLLRARIRAEGQVAEIGYDSGVGENDSANKSANAKQSGTAPAESSQPQQLASNGASPAAAKSTQNTSKPIRIIRRKAIDVP